MANDPAHPTRTLATLVSPAGPSDAAAIAVTRPVARVGQGPQNDIVLDDDTVSTNHAQLELSPSGWLLTDLESKNGTFIDGVRLASQVPTPLVNGATVAFGGLQLGFVASDSVDAESAREEFETAARSATPPATARRAPLRLPVWLLALVILFIALLVTLFLVFGGDPQVVEPVVDPATALVQHPSAVLRAA